MFVRLKTVIALGAIAVSSVVPSAAIAQVYVNAEQFELIDLENIPDAFNYELSEQSGDSFDRNRFYGPVQTLFGLPSFMEIAIARDAEDIDKFYRELLELQVNSGPYLRTLDLPNPFDSSLRVSPTATGPAVPLPGSEFLFEVAPLR
ncbi:MAG: hypothetical protein SW833_04705 [Cyanobacteriota bacterium]|nr:hypothetical protein [Cyanobacteriota bacterium]